MQKYILCFVCLANSVNLFSQESKSGNIWENGLGKEKAFALRQAVAKYDSSLELVSDPVIRYNDHDLPFMLLGTGGKVLIYLQEKKAPIFNKLVDVYSYTDVKLRDQQLKD